MPADTVRVAILDDHQSIIDGYTYRLTHTPGWKLSLRRHLGRSWSLCWKNILWMFCCLISASVRRKKTQTLSRSCILSRNYCKNIADLVVLVISMFVEPGLMRSIVEAGASGYMLKDDTGAFRELGNVVLSVAHGGIFFSRRAR